MRARHVLRALVAGLLAGALGGCLLLPVPVPKHGFGLISRETIARIAPGASSRIDVLFLLGEPRLRLGEDRAFLFEWEEARADWVLIAPGAAGGAPISTLRALAVAFGPDGRVERVREFRWSSAMGFRAFPKDEERAREVLKWVEGTT